MKNHLKTIIDWLNTDGANVKPYIPNEILRPAEEFLKSNDGYCCGIFATTDCKGCSYHESKNSTPITLGALKEIGFAKPKNGFVYSYRDITARQHEEYFFFKYCGKDLPISSSMESLKLLIAGIYGEILQP